jgi:hypothetical protein
VSFDHKSRGSSLNYDLYGFDSEQNVAVIQARQAFRERAKHYMRLRKTYLLAGHNENGSPFAHPVGTQAVRKAARSGTPSHVVRAAQKWMWLCTDRQLDVGVRQGDILLVPERGEPKGVWADLGTSCVVGNNHVVRAQRIVKTGSWVWAVNPTIVHQRGQHELVCATEHDGWYSVRVAMTATSWDFAPRSVD